MSANDDPPEEESFSILVATGNYYLWKRGSSERIMEIVSLCCIKPCHSTRINCNQQN